MGEEAGLACRDGGQQLPGGSSLFRVGMFRVAQRIR
jgi:hypothetical protein